MRKRKPNPRLSHTARYASGAKRSKRRRRKQGRFKAAYDSALAGRKDSSASRNWVLSAWKKGVSLAAESPWPKREDPLAHMQRLWVRYMLGNDGGAVPSEHYVSVMHAFVEGYSTASGYRTNNWVLLPTEKTVAAVVTVMNEERSVGAVLRELERMPLHEIVLVVNGSRDGSFAAARQSRRAVIAHFNKPLGHDVGRAVGARLTVSDIVLFTDADFLVQAERFIPFVRAVDRGMDVALNDIFPFMGTFAERDGVSTLKEFLNRALNRADLTVNSLTAVPHALSRRAIERIGASQLAVPPKAHAIALSSGLAVGAPGSVDVISANRQRDDNTGTSNAVAQMIVGDHVEALEWAMRERGARLSFADHLRARGLAGGGDARC